MTSKIDPIGNLSGDQLLVLDIAKKQSKKRIKNLRKGRGPLFDKVVDTITEMKADGTLSADVKPVVIIVRQREDGTQTRGIFSSLTGS